MRRRRSPLRWSWRFSALAVGFGSLFLARSLDLIDLFAFVLLACSSSMALAIGASVYLALARHSNH